jgi:ATP-dependent protease HslVU (ClpYQ) peptidase subunit
MTCIIAIKDGRTIIMSADSAASTEDKYSIQKVPKVFKLAVPGSGPVDMLVGFAGCFRGAQILKHAFVVPEWTTGTHEDYLVGRFLPELCKALQAVGIGTKEDPLGLLTLLIGLQGRLFEVESNGQLLESVKTYAAIGTGADTALAAIAVLLDHTDDSPWTILDKALAYSADFCTSVRGPFHTDYVMTC